MPALTPEQQAEQNKLFERYIELLQTADGYTRQAAENIANTAKYVFYLFNAIIGYVTWNDDKKKGTI